MDHDTSAAHPITPSAASWPPPSSRVRLLARQNLLQAGRRILARVDACCIPKFRRSRKRLYHSTARSRSRFSPNCRDPEDAVHHQARVQSAPSQHSSASSSGASVPGRRDEAAGYRFSRLLRPAKHVQGTRVAPERASGQSGTISRARSAAASAPGNRAAHTHAGEAGTRASVIRVAAELLLDGARADSHSPFSISVSIRFLAIVHVRYRL